MAEVRPQRDADFVFGRLIRMGNFLRLSATFWKELSKYAFGLGLLAFVVWSHWRPADPESGPGLADALQRPIHLQPLLIAACLGAVCNLVMFIRWYLLVRAHNLPVRLGTAIRLGSIGLFFNTLLPGAIGGDFVKAVALARSQERRTVAVATILFDRAVGLTGLFFLATVAAGVSWLLDPSVFVEHPALRRVVVVNVAIFGGIVGFWELLRFLPQWRADRFAGRLS